MARRRFPIRGVRFRNGELAGGVGFVAYTDTAGTVLADVADTSGGASLAGSAFTLGSLGNYELYGPPDDTDELYLRCPTDTTLGVQRIISDPDERLDALEAGGSGVTDHGALTGLADDDHPQYETSVEAAAKVTAHEGTANPHPTYATDADLTTHAGAADPHTGYVLESAHTLATHDALLLATDAELTAHDGDADAHHAQAHSISGADHTGTLAHTALSSVTADQHHAQAHADAQHTDGPNLKPAIFDAKGDLIAATAADTASRLAVGANDTVLTADSAQATGLKWAAAAGGGIPATLLDAKGDLIAASAADTAARLAVGSNGQVLAADSTQSSGLKWRSPPLVGTFPQTIDGRIANTAAQNIGLANRTVYMLVTEGPVQDVSSLVVRIGTSSGNIAVAVYSSTGTGRSRAPATRLATSGSVASPGTGEQTISLGATVTVTPFETWFAFAADNVTVTAALLSVASSVQTAGLAGNQTAYPPPTPAGAITATQLVYWVVGI